MEFLSNPWYKQTFGSKLCRLLKLLPDSDLAALVLQMYRFFHNFQLKNNKQKNPQLKSGKQRKLISRAPQNMTDPMWR